jgi:hypothetical protein
MTLAKSMDADTISPAYEKTIEKVDSAATKGFVGANMKDMGLGSQGAPLHCAWKIAMWTDSANDRALTIKRLAWNQAAVLQVIIEGGGLQ